MTSFLQKLRVVTLGSVHDLLDKTIDMNSPSALRQYTRDLEDALDRMKNEAAIQAGTVRTMEREHGDLEHQIEVKKAAITKLLSASKDNMPARLRATEVVTLQSRLTALGATLMAQRLTSTNLDAATAKLEAKHADVVARVRELERIDRDSKAKESAASAMTQAGKLIASGSEISIDDIETKMRARNDVASEKFDRAMKNTDIPNEDADKAQAVDSLLDELRPKSEAVKP